MSSINNPQAISEDLSAPAVEKKKAKPNGFANIAILGFSAIKFGKLFTVVGTMALSVLTYSMIWGWRYAVGFVLLLLVHEMGHFLACRQKGMNVGVPTFIPFVGAWIELKDRPINASTEAYIAFAGPLFGTLGALACYGGWLYFDDRLFLALSYAGFFLNLFNLIPLSPFDGGRITAVLSPRVWFFGAPILIGLFILHPNPLLVVMAILALPQLIKAFKYNPAAPQNAIYYGTRLQTKLMYGVLYIALACFLAIMCHDTHTLLESVAGNSP